VNPSVCSFFQRFTAALAAAAHKDQWRAPVNLGGPFLKLAEWNELRAHDVFLGVLDWLAHIHQAAALGEEGIEFSR
jgi:hypothetical protein